MCGLLRSSSRRGGSNAGVVDRRFLKLQGLNFVAGSGCHFFYRARRCARLDIGKITKALKLDTTRFGSSVALDEIETDGRRRHRYANTCGDGSTAEIHMHT